MLMSTTFLYRVGKLPGSRPGSTSRPPAAGIHYSVLVSVNHEYILMHSY